MPYGPRSLVKRKWIQPHQDVRVSWCRRWARTREAAAGLLWTQMSYVPWGSQTLQDGMFTCKHENWNRSALPILKISTCCKAAARFRAVSWSLQAQTLRFSLTSTDGGGLALGPASRFHSHVSGLPFPCLLLHCHYRHQASIPRPPHTLLGSIPTPISSPALQHTPCGKGYPENCRLGNSYSRISHTVFVFWGFFFFALYTGSFYFFHCSSTLFIFKIGLPWWLIQ